MNRAREIREELRNRKSIVCGLSGDVYVEGVNGGLVKEKNK
jgi:hypothetical protein